MQIKKISIKDIKESPYNPRKQLKAGDPEYESIKKSIAEFELVEPLVWNETTGNLVRGHQRLRVLKDQGVKKVDVSVVKIPLAKEKMLNIALNKISGDWDMKKLDSVLFELVQGDKDINLTGFTKDEIQSKEFSAELKKMAKGIKGDESLTIGGDRVVWNDKSILIVFENEEQLKFVRDKLESVRRETGKTVGDIIHGLIFSNL